MASSPRAILVGGAPLAGKSSLAQALAGRLDMACIATDDLSTAIQAITNAETHPALHDLDVDGRYRDHDPSHSPERLMDGALAFHRAAWPAIEAVARAHANWDRPALIEGWGILPEFVAGLGLENLGALFLVPDEAVYERRCRANPDFYQGAADEEGLIQSFARRSMLFSRMLEASAEKHGLPVVRSTGEMRLEETVELALSLLG